MININNIFKNLAYKYVSEEIAVEFDGYYLTYPSDVINFFNNNSHFRFHTNFALIINKEQIGATYILKYYVPTPTLYQHILIYWFISPYLSFNIAFRTM